MQNQRCPFCPRSRRPLQHAEPAGTPVLSFAPNLRAAIPVFMGRVSPVLDTCTHLVIVDTVPDGATGRRRSIPVGDSSIYDRTRQLQRLGVQMVICAAVSDDFFHLLRRAGIQVRPGIAGAIDEVIAAFGNGSLDQPQFRMPGADPS